MMENLVEYSLCEKNAEEEAMRELLKYLKAPFMLRLT